MGGYLGWEEVERERFGGMGLGMQVTRVVAGFVICISIPHTKESVSKSMPFLNWPFCFGLPLYAIDRRDRE